MGLEIKILFYPLSVHILQSNNSQLQLQKSMDISSHSFMYWYNGKKIQSSIVSQKKRFSFIRVGKKSGYN